MKIEIWSDYSCPFCYMGKVSLDQALLECGLKDKVEIIYKAYQLDPYAPKEASYSASENLVRKYQVSQSEALAMLNSTTLKAQELGLTFKYDWVQSTSTLDAHRLLKLLPKAKKASVHLALYDAYFTQGKNLAQIETLLKLSQTTDGDLNSLKEQLSTQAGLKEVLEDLQEAKKIGIHGVPYMRINTHTILQGAQPVLSLVETLKAAYLKEIQKLNRE